MYSDGSVAFVGDSKRRMSQSILEQVPVGIADYWKYLIPVLERGRQGRDVLQMKTMAEVATGDLDVMERCRRRSLAAFNVKAVDVSDPILIQFAQNVMQQQGDDNDNRGEAETSSGEHPGESAAGMKADKNTITSALDLSKVDHETVLRFVHTRSCMCVCVFKRLVFLFVFLHLPCCFTCTCTCSV